MENALKIIDGVNKETGVELNTSEIEIIEVIHRSDWYILRTKDGQIISAAIDKENAQYKEALEKFTLDNAEIINLGE